MRIRSSPLFAGSVVLAGLFAGCGSGSSSTSTTAAGDAAAGSAMADYIVAADAVCEAENERLTRPGEELESVLRKAQKTGVLVAAAGAVKEFSVEVEQGLARLEALESPPAQRDEVEAMLATQAGQVRLMGELSGAFESGDRTAAQKFETRLVNSKKRYGAQTARLGFKVCGLRSRHG
jgi:hypothetical protein